MGTHDVRTYRLQLLAMLSMAGRRPRLDQPIPTQSGVTLHRCGLFLPVRARSSGAAVQMFEKEATTADIASPWTRAFHGPQHHGRWPKPATSLPSTDNPNGNVRRTATAAFPVSSTAGSPR